MKKFWTMKDGQVGTAHKNRHGEEVDFRPGECFLEWVEGGSSQRPGMMSDVPDEEAIKSAISLLRVVLVPAKGVQCESLVLPSTSIDYESSVDNRGVVMVRVNRMVATYEGLEFQSSKDRLGAAILVNFYSLVARQAQRQAAVEQLEQLRQQHPAATALTPREAITFGKPVFAKLRHQNPLDWKKAAVKVQQNLLRHFAITDIRILPTWAQDLETLRSHILEQRVG